MAGNSERIDDVVDPVALKQVNDLKDAAALLEKQFTDTAAAATRLNNATGNSRSFRDYNTNATRAATETAKLQQAQQNLARATILLQQAEQRLVTMTNQRTISDQRLEAQTARTAAAQERATQAALRALSPYQQLSRELDKQRALAKDLAVTYGENSIQFQVAAANVQALDGRLRNIDQTLGQSQRNVGNYGSAFAGLSRAYGLVRIAANILPGLGISGIFLLLFEGIKKVTEAIGLFSDKLSQAQTDLLAFNEVNKAANIEAGKQSSNLRILYQAATDVTNSIHNRTLAARELQKEFPDTFRNITTETILNGGASASYQQLTKDIIANAKAKAVADKLGKIEADLFDSDVQQQKIKNAQSNEEARAIDAVTKRLVGQGVAYDEARKAATKATFEQSKYETQVRKAGGVLATKVDDSDPRGINGELNSIRARANDAIKAELEKQKILKNTRDFLIKLAGGNNAVAAGIAQNDTPKTPKQKDDSKQVLNDQLQAQKELLDGTLNNENAGYEERLRAIETFEIESYQIINKGESDKVLTELETTHMIKGIQNEALKDRNKANKDFYTEQSKIINDALNRDIQANKDALTKAESLLTQANDVLLDDAQKSSDEQLQILAEQYKNGEISLTQYNKKKNDIEKLGALNSEAIVIDGLEKLISIRLAAGKDETDDIKKLNALKRKYAKDSTDYEISQAEKLASYKEKAKGQEKELADKSFNLIQTLVDAGYQNQLNAIQGQKDALDKQTAAQIDAENRSLDSTSDKADKIAIINAKAAAQQDILDQKARATKQKQAQADRLFNIAKIIENTAVGITATIRDLGFPAAIPFVALVAALGAVELATVLATPIPKYQHGTDNAKGGVSLVGEVGKEYVIQPDGDAYFTPSSPTLMDIPKGSKVISNMELMSIMANPFKQRANISGNDNKKMIDAINNGTNKTVKALRNNRPKNPVINGWAKEMVAMNQFNIKRNNHFQ